MQTFLNPEHEKAYQLLKNQSYPEALILFDNLVYLFPDEPNLYSDRGVLHIHLKNKSLALSDFDKAVELDSSYGYRYAARAYAKDFFGDTQAALNDYELAIQYDPEDAISINNLGLLQEKLGYQKKAKENFEKADHLAKMNEAFNELMQEAPLIENSTVETSESSLEDDTKATKRSVGSEFLKIFSSRKQFKDFLQFVRKGGKI
jgi:tetratricopeptide (TPR) repeat protein